MATAEELLATLSSSTSNLIDEEPSFAVIKADRTIDIPEKYRIIGTNGDHNSEVITFKCPRFIDGHDIYTCDKHWVSWENPGGGFGRYDVANIEARDDGHVYFEWIVESRVGAYPGTINFAVHFLDITTNGVINYRWSTAKNKQLQVVETVFNEEEDDDFVYDIDLDEEALMTATDVAIDIALSGEESYNAYDSVFSEYVEDLVLNVNESVSDAAAKAPIVIDAYPTVLDASQKAQTVVDAAENISVVEEATNAANAAASSATDAASAANIAAANVKDGVSATHSWNGTVLTITSASGTSSADLKGETGQQGLKGDTGATGPKGDKGDTGDKGDKGDTGATGPKGDTGAAFTYDMFTQEQLAALTGPKGDKGDKGDTGEKLNYSDLTESDKEELAAKIGSQIAGLEYHFCSSSEYDSSTGIPNFVGSENVFYFVPNNGETPNRFTEFLYTANGWEQVGSSTINLDGYLKDTDIYAWAKAANKPTYTASEVGAATADHTHSQYLTSFTESDPTVPEWAKAATKPTYTASEVGAAASDHTHDQYLTSYTETDPTVPAWAKEDTKPTYTASEVGAAEANHTHDNYLTASNLTGLASMSVSGNKLVITTKS